MNPNSPKVPAEAEADLKDDWKRTTGIRERVADIGTWPPRAERMAYFERTHENRLAHEMEAQVDQWADKKILKAALILDSDETRTAIAESTLNRCQTSNKIHHYDMSVDDGKTVFNVYYKYR